MDTVEKISLVKRPPTSEVVTDEALDDLVCLKSEAKTLHRLEISGFLHLGSLVVQAGRNCSLVSRLGDPGIYGMAGLIYEVLAAVKTGIQNLVCQSR